MSNTHHQPGRICATERADFAARGLYDPGYEHDACGVGFVASIKGEQSHAIIETGLQILKNLVHRGASGSDAETGDGAGMLVQVPDAFLRRECEALGIPLPGPEQYGVGMVFLPTHDDARARCEEAIEVAVRREGQRFLGWRDVPRNSDAIGADARQYEPVIRQFFVGRDDPLHLHSANAADSDYFERKLFVIRKVIERAVADGVDLNSADDFYIASLSCRKIIYKGMLLAHQIPAYYLDLGDPAFASAIALVHQRFSTNTFPSWPLAHPFRYIAHNGEINTLRGNRNWMRAREGNLASEVLGEDLPKLFPLVNQYGSDSATLDNALELLVMGGRSLAHAMLMLIPEAWDGNNLMDDERKAFYEYHACLMEPWDGPAGVAFTDGRQIGAVLDRNGLRPARYVVTKDGLVIMASETGVIEIAPENIEQLGRLQPGRTFLVDTVAGRILPDEEIKSEVARRQPYRQWLDENRTFLKDHPEGAAAIPPDHETITNRQRAFGYTEEDLRFLMAPMAASGEETVGSMGTDTPLSVLSHQVQPLYTYFKQLFAQVTNPPIDPIRESLVMSLVDYVGKKESVLAETPAHCRQLRLDTPILKNEEMEKLRALAGKDGHRACVLPILFEASQPAGALERALERVCRKASDAAEEGCTVLILSTRSVDEQHAPIPTLLAVSAVHHHLIREGLRNNVSLIAETGDAREVHHFACLIGYGASAVNPYLAFETLADLIRENVLKDTTYDKAVYSFLKGANKGLYKIFSKMGISTLQSYRGAQIFEAVGLSTALVERYFTGTASRIEGIGLDEIERECRALHEAAYPSAHIPGSLHLEPGGQYQWRRYGEYHAFNPDTVAKLQHAVRQEGNGNGKGYATFKEFSRLIDKQSEEAATLRGMMTFKPLGEPIPIEEVEPAKEIVKRFVTGAMSLGSISREAHETLAIAMNRLGGKSNTGEGGEDPARFERDPNGDWRRSAIKQVASARFGVTTHYLVNADELQIKMAQGAKPGEGGALAGLKVDEYIGMIRHSTPGVTLISPPPHHDIYSIEDLKQLIFDLKNVNPQARISVKLVAEVGVGTVAAGVAKAHADHVLISGYEGGTGNSPLSSIKHAGVPWELGLAETQQILVLNNLRGRIRVQTDGQLKTGRDVAVAALLGAEEFGFSSAPLVAEGCIMMRVCHLNTCPVGIATQDPILRAKFNGKPEQVVNYFFFVAEEVREIMASLGFRTMNEMIGRTECLDVDQAVRYWKARGLDLSRILFQRPLVGDKQPEISPDAPRYCVESQDHELAAQIDYQLIDACKPALEDGKPVRLSFPIRNFNRTVGTMLSGEVAKRFGGKGLAPDTIQIAFRGSAGQSFGCFLAPGVSLTLEGDANDYLGKGMSGGRIVVYPPREAEIDPAENVVVGNTLLYGATGGEAYLSGVAGERFAVRNSGVRAVIEGVGDHGCEYMTGGYTAILGKTGRNFAAGMSGGIAYVYDIDGRFADRINPDATLLREPVADPEDVERLRAMIEAHHRYTGSARARCILDGWEETLPRFVKVISQEYKNLLAQRQAEQKTEAEQKVISTTETSKQPVDHPGPGKDDRTAPVLHH